MSSLLLASTPNTNFFSFYCFFFYPNVCVCVSAGGRPVESKAAKSTQACILYYRLYLPIRLLNIYVTYVTKLALHSY